MTRPVIKGPIAQHRGGGSPPPPPPAAGTGLMLIAYASTLKNMSHTNDGTYDVIVGDWGDAARLSVMPSETYAYTVTTAGVAAANATNFVILDPTGQSGLAGALTPDAYITKLKAAFAANPGLSGFFLDNCTAYASQLINCTAAQFEAAIQQVGDALAAAGIKWLANTGGYISGNAGSNDGSLWIEWAQLIEPHFTRLLVENWQEAYPSSGNTKRLRGTAWYEEWDGWQRCVAAVPGKFAAMTYEKDTSTYSYGVYGRASMLTAPGADPRNVFGARTTLQGADPYGTPWLATPTNPTVDPVAGTAHL